MKHIILSLVIFLTVHLTTGLAQETMKIDPYAKVLKKFEKLPEEKKLPFIVTLKVHAALQLGELAKERVKKGDTQDYNLFIRLSQETNKNLIDFAKNANAKKFVALFQDEINMLGLRQREEISGKSFKEWQEKHFKDTHTLMETVRANKDFNDLVTSSRKDISYFHKHHFLNALNRAVESMKKQF